METIKDVIFKWEQIRIKLHNEGVYKRQCHIDASAWFDKAKTIAEIIVDLKILIK